MQIIVPEGSMYHTICIVAACMSIVFSFILILILNKKKSNYARIMRHIVINESIFIFSMLMIVSIDSYEGVYTVVSNVMYYLSFGLMRVDETLLKLANMGAYLCCESISLLLNFFVCFELILVLKNPIAQTKNRLKMYFLIATVTSCVVFFISFFTIRGTNIMQGYTLTNIYYSYISIYINLAIYLLFCVIGIISIVYLFCRFCVGRSLLQNLRNFFVIRHAIYVFVYILVQLPTKTNVLITILDRNPVLFLEGGIQINLAMGFFMFIIRASETNFYNRVICCRNNANLNTTQGGTRPSVDDPGFFDKDQPLTAIISRNMNLEFMCCILYGLTEIFVRPERKFKLSEDTSLEATLTLQLQMSSQERSLLKSIKNITNNDFKRAKTHKIIYKKIFNDSIDFEQVGVEVDSVPKKKRNVYDSSIMETESYLGEVKETEHDALIIEYCPRVFRELRKMDDITGYNLEDSFSPMSNIDNIHKIKESEGKSGSFFFFTHDNRFLIKTITNNELNTVLGNFMKGYYEHVSENMETLMAKIYGIYTIVINGVSKINIILMQNLICIPRQHIKRIFDLKGSRVERITKNIEKCDKMKALKDLDYLWMIQIEEDLVDFTKDIGDELSSVLENDLTMLREVGVMDYSLLFIILHLPKENDPDYETIINLFGDPRYCRRIFKSQNMKYLYILGIIDYLQKFNVAKFFENKYKRLIYGNESYYVSAVDPMIYSERMFNFAKDFIFISQSI